MKECFRCPSGTYKTRHLVYRDASSIAIYAFCVVSYCFKAAAADNAESNDDALVSLFDVDVVLVPVNEDNKLDAEDVVLEPVNEDSKLDVDVLLPVLDVSNELY